MPTLYEISDELRRIDAFLAEREGDLSGVEAMVDAWLSAVGDALLDKADGYAGLIAELEHRAGARASEAERMHRRAKADGSNAAWLKAELKGVLEQRGIAKLETSHFRISIVRNGGAVPLLLSPEFEQNPPQEFARTIPSQTVPDKDAVRAALEAGRQVEGAKLGERGTWLAIK
jgi:hypothetical protein